jgi:ubiquinone biosynthesis protein Coq4
VDGLASLVLCKTTHISPINCHHNHLNYHYQSTVQLNHISIGIKIEMAGKLALVLIVLIVIEAASCGVLSERVMKTKFLVER